MNYDRFNYITKLFNLDCIKNIDVERTNYSLTNNIPRCDLYLNKTIYECKYCCSDDIKFKEYSLMNIKHSTLNGTLCNITFHRRKYLCEVCSKSTYEELGIFRTHKGISQTLDLEILEKLKDPTLTYKKISNLFNVSTTYVSDIFDKYVSVKRKTFSECVSIDEIYSKKLTKTKYCCILYNPIDNKIIDIVDSRRIESLNSYFYGVNGKERDSVMFFTSDLNETYRTVHNRFFKNSIHAVDSFHVIENLNRLLNDVRIREMKKLEELKDYSNSSYWLLKKFYKLLFKKDDEIYNKQYEFKKFDMILDKYSLIDEMLKCSDDLKESYYLVQEYRNFNEYYRGDEVSLKFDELISLFFESKIDEMRRFGSLLISWKNEIINSFIYIGNWRLSNGKMERANRFIKLMFSNAYGYSNFPRTRNRIIYSYNKDTSLLNTPNIFNNKRKMKPRGKYKK